MEWAVPYRSGVRALVVLTALTVLAVAGCGGSHKKLVHVRVGAGAARSAFLVRALQVARASNRELSIFPATFGRRKCSIPRALGGVHAGVEPLRGTCRTGFQYTGDDGKPRTIVTFTERWAWPPCQRGEDCVAGGHHRRHSWMVTVERPATATRKPVVVATRETGAPAPQAPRP
jgi:hypothetical protein